MRYRLDATVPARFFHRILLVSVLKESIQIGIFIGPRKKKKKRKER